MIERDFEDRDALLRATIWEICNRALSPGGLDIDDAVSALYDVMGIEDDGTTEWEDDRHGVISLTARVVVEDRVGLDGTPEIVMPPALFRGVCRTGMSAMQNVVVDTVTVQTGAGTCVEGVLVSPRMGPSMRASHLYLVPTE